MLGMLCRCASEASRLTGPGNCCPVHLSRGGSSWSVRSWLGPPSGFALTPYGCGTVTSPQAGCALLVCRSLTFLPYSLLPPQAVPSWFVRVEDIKERLLANNAATYWVPAYVKEKRFHNWLENARDWVRREAELSLNKIARWACVTIGFCGCQAKGPCLGGCERPQGGRHTRGAAIVTRRTASCWLLANAS